MKKTARIRALPFTLASILTLAVIVPSASVGAQGYKPGEKPVLVPRGEYVRQVYNNEALVNVGYRNANNSVGGEWMLLEVGMTVFKGHAQNITRDAFVLETPDGKKIPLATQAEAQANTKALRSLNMRADIQSEPINYFPTQAQAACWIGFFADPSDPDRGLPFDEFGLSTESACMGRLFFNVPDGIEYGRYYLHVKLANSELAVPLNVMTKQQLKQAKKQYKEYVKEQKKKAKEAKKSGN
jgi:hypothetical protein